MQFKKEFLKKLSVLITLFYSLSIPSVLANRDVPLTMTAPPPQPTTIASASPAPAAPVPATTPLISNTLVPAGAITAAAPIMPAATVPAPASSPTSATNSMDSPRPGGPLTASSPSASATPTALQQAPSTTGSTPTSPINAVSGIYTSLVSDGYFIISRLEEIPFRDTLLRLYRNPYIPSYQRLVNATRYQNVGLLQRKTTVEYTETMEWDLATRRWVFTYIFGTIKDEYTQEFPPAPGSDCENCLQKDTLNYSFSNDGTGFLGSAALTSWSHSMTGIKNYGSLGTPIKHTFDVDWTARYAENSTSRRTFADGRPNLDWYAVDPFDITDQPSGAGIIVSGHDDQIIEEWPVLSIDQKKHLEKKTTIRRGYSQTRDGMGTDTRIVKQEETYDYDSYYDDPAGSLTFGAVPKPYLKSIQVKLTRDYDTLTLGSNGMTNFTTYRGTDLQFTLTNEIRYDLSQRPLLYHKTLIGSLVDSAGNTINTSLQWGEGVSVIGMNGERNWTVVSGVSDLANTEALLWLAAPVVMVDSLMHQLRMNQQMLGTHYPPLSPATLP